MTLHRFFVPPAAAIGERFPLPEPIRRQVRSVLRLGDGARIVLLVGDGEELVCTLAGEECVVEARRPAAGEPAHRLIVVQALLKGSGLEEVVQHGTELGVARFELMISERCVARELSGRKLERLRAIARESAEQAERGVVPEVVAPIAFEAALRPASVLLYERDEHARLSRLAPAERVIIGPEGGFTRGEVERARAAGAMVAGLGRRILRSQTVAPAVAAVILSRTGDFA